MLSAATMFTNEIGQAIPVDTPHVSGIPRSFLALRSLQIEHLAHRAFEAKPTRLSVYRFRRGKPMWPMKKAMNGSWAR